MKPEVNKNKIVPSDNTPDPMLKKFDDLYGTLKRLTKADGDMRKLKDVINAIEKKVSKRRNFESETEISRGGSHKRQKRSNNVIIPKVYKKYTSTRHAPNEAIIFDDGQCPKWLLLVAESYMAMRECYFEIKEELRVICNKFAKQESYYTNMCDRRIVGMSDEFAKNLANAVNAVNLRYSEKRDKLTIKIGEQLQELEIKQHKEEQLKSVNNQIQKEIQKIVTKYVDVSPALQVETVFNEGVEARLQQYISSATEKADLMQSLRQKLEEKKENINEVRTTNCLCISKMMEDIHGLTSSYSKAHNKEKILNTKLSETNKAIKDLKEIIFDVNSSKEFILHLLCKKEEEMTGLTDTLKLHKIISPDTLDKKKRLQEKYQGLYTHLCEENKKFMDELEAKNKEIEKINTTIFEEKTNYIVPLKLQINEYREKLQKLSDECTATKENNLILKKAGYKLENEHTDLVKLEKKIKFLLVKSKCQLSRTRKRLNIRPQSANSLLSRESDVPSLCTGSSTEFFWNHGSSLSVSQSESELTVTSREGRSGSTVSMCICYELEDTMLLNTIDALCTFKEMTIKLKRLKKLRKSETALCRAVINRRIQIHHLEEAKVLIALEYACTLSMKFNSHFDKSSEQLDKKDERAEPAEEEYVTARGAASNPKVDAATYPPRELSKSTSGEYVDKTAKELHAQFSKLLFM